MERTKNKMVRVIIENAGTNLSAYIEGAPIITVGDTVNEVKANIEEAIDLYLEDNPTPCEMLRGEYELVFELEEKLAERRRKKSATKQKALQPA